VADVSESNVKVFGPKGALLKVIGRRGEGPGEFFAPTILQRTASGRLHVLDGRLLRISVFDEQYNFVRTVHLPPKIAYFTAMVLDTGGMYFLAGIAPEGVAVMRMDSAGRVLNTYDVGSRGSRGLDKMWRVLLYPFLAATDRKVFLVTPIQDSLYAFRRADGVASSAPIPIPEVALRKPPPVTFDRAGFASWADSFFRPAGVYAYGEEVIVPVQRGNRQDSATTVLAIMSREGKWNLLSAAPSVLDIQSQRLLALLNPDPDRIVLGLFERRR
jgi:hypothetical protein